MTSFPELVQPYLDILESVILNILYCCVPLCIGASAALNMKNFLYATIFAGLSFSILPAFSRILPANSIPINSLFMFLIIGYSVSMGIKLAFNNWRGY